MAAVWLHPADSLLTALCMSRLCPYSVCVAIFNLLLCLNISCIFRPTSRLFFLCLPDVICQTNSPFNSIDLCGQSVKVWLFLISLKALWVSGVSVRYCLINKNLGGHLHVLHEAIHSATVLWKQSTKRIEWILVGRKKQLRSCRWKTVNINSICLESPLMWFWCEFFFGPHFTLRD